MHLGVMDGYTKRAGALRIHIVAGKGLHVTGLLKSRSCKTCSLVRLEIVVGRILDRNALVGTIPSTVGLLTALRVL